MAVKKASAKTEKKTAVKKKTAAKKVPSAAKKKAPAKKIPSPAKAKKPTPSRTVKPSGAATKPAAAGAPPQVPPRDQCYVKELGGNSFVIVVERAHNFFDISEMRTLVAICHSAPGAKEAAAVMFRWLTEHRKDVLIDSGISTNGDVALLSIYSYLVNHYAVRRD